MATSISLSLAHKLALRSVSPVNAALSTLTAPILPARYAQQAALQQLVSDGRYVARLMRMKVMNRSLAMESLKIRPDDIVVCARRTSMMVPEACADWAMFCVQQLHPIIKGNNTTHGQMEWVSIMMIDALHQITQRRVPASRPDVVIQQGMKVVLQSFAMAPEQPNTRTFMNSFSFAAAIDYSCRRTTSQRRQLSEAKRWAGSGKE
jgi:hypothetical protein